MSISVVLSGDVIVGVEEADIELELLLLVELGLELLELLLGLLELELEPELELELVDPVEVLDLEDGEETEEVYVVPLFVWVTMFVVSIGVGVLTGSVRAFPVGGWFMGEDA